MDDSKNLGDFINVQEETDPQLQELADSHNVILLAFIGSYVPKRYDSSNSNLASISIADEFGVEEALKQIAMRTKNFEKRKVYFLVNSLGGNLNSSFKTALSIKESFDDITVFVPHKAVSGGTLLALTGNKIRMGIMSHLGPVDPQVPYGDLGHRVSVNSLLRAKERIDLKFETQSEHELPYTDRHMVKSIDPVICEEFIGIRQEIIGYLNIILKNNYDSFKISHIVDSLAFTLPTHNFVIRRNLARQIGLNVDYADDDIVWDKMKQWLAKYVVMASDKHFIRYCIPKNNKK